MEDFQRKPLQCPRCSGFFRKAFMRKLRHQSGAILDICDSCGGMWLDKAEVMLLSRHQQTIKKKPKVKKK